MRRVLLLLATLAAAGPAAAIDVTGSWQVFAAPAPAVSIVQTGGTLAMCLPGVGNLATGSIDESSGAFTLHFDLTLLGNLGFLLCTLDWSGTFAPDASSFTGSEIRSAISCIPPPFSCHPECLPPVTAPITGTRVGPPGPCCGNGVVETGERCDDRTGCCTASCQVAPSGTRCTDDGNICTTDTCDGAGTCLHVSNTFRCDAGPCAVAGTCTNGSCVPDPPRAQGFPCNLDGDVCTLDTCDGAGRCLPGPTLDCGPCRYCDPFLFCRLRIRNDCREGGAGSRVTIRRTPIVTGDALDWRWREGASQTSPPDFGEPPASTGYELCVFYHDQFLNEAPLLAAEAPAGGVCAGSPCWKPATGGWRYRDPEGTPGGLTALQLFARTGHRASLAAKGKGARLPLPASLPVPHDLIVQLSADGASACWSSTFRTPRIANPTTYQARSSRR